MSDASKSKQSTDILHGSNLELNIHQLKDWTRQAGEIALQSFEKKIAVFHKPDDSLLTQTDRDIDHFLTQQIQTAYPTHKIISEEGGESGGTESSSCIWVIDPLDGTTVFSQGLPGWGISIGLLQEGQPIFGLFYMPYLDDMTCTTEFGTVQINGKDIEMNIQSDWGAKGFLATTARAHHQYQITVHRTRTLGSVGANLIYTARGTATACFLPKPRLWDLVAGAAIVKQAGGELRYLSGREINYTQLLDGKSTPEPVIAGSQKLLSTLQNSIWPRTP